MTKKIREREHEEKSGSRKMGRKSEKWEMRKK